MQKFLLHTCCAPCSIAIIDELKNQFDLTVFFYNPNIFPREEYLKRKAEVVKVCEEWQVPMIDQDGDADEWHEKVAKGLEMVEEGGERCHLCFRFRLAKAAEYAGKNNFEYYSSSLTSGRNKPAIIINEIGENFAKIYKIKFYDVDWKKDGRQEKGRKMVDDRGIYRQNYCGCERSLEQHTRYME
jgi:hypothetical protein